MIPLRLICCFAISLAICGSVAFANETYKIDPARSTIAFKVRHMLGTAKGKFTKFNGTIGVDREQPDTSSVTVSIQAASIDTGIAKRDDHLRTADFFDVQKFPEITFKSQKVNRTGPNTGEIVGNLTMHGVTREITLNVQLLGTPEQAGKDQTTRWRVTTAPIKRSQFAFEPASMIGDDVTVDIQIEATREK
jgi:polyisoprenoid-binding protein YceI